MTEPTPTPEQNSPVAPDENTSTPEQNSPVAPDENTSTPERDGFFRRVQRVLKPESLPVHPSKREEIVLDLPPIKKIDSDGQT
jgi:hypothetical protein